MGWSNKNLGSGYSTKIDYELAHLSAEGEQTEMPLTRRKFLRTGVLSVFAAGFTIASARIGLAQKSAAGREMEPVVDIQAQKDPVFWFKPETFKPYVGGFFEAPNALGEMIELELVKLQTFIPSKNALRVTKMAGETESFTLLFKAAAQLPPFTSIHRIKHPSLGEFYLFLTPRKGESGELFYEAVINHIL